MRKLILLLFLCLIAVGSLPVSAQTGSVAIPIGSDSYKIVVSEDGIYEVSYEELAAAGMDVAAVNPNTFEMMHKGEPMAYELIGNGNDVFEAGEAVRFFGWAFDGSTHDGWFVDANYYWLWADGSPTMVESRPSAPGGTAVDTWRSTLIFEEDIMFHPTYTNDWDEWKESDPELTFDEADVWFWARIASNPAGVSFHSTTGSWDTPNEVGPITPEMGQPFREFTVEIPHPVADGTDATMVTEVFSFCEPSQIETHKFSASLNGETQVDSWTGRYGRSFDQLIPAETLIDGDNILRYDALTPPEDIKASSTCGSLRYNSDLLLPNRSILSYDRQLAAVNDQLLFTYATGGTHDFMVNGFTTGSAADAIVWEVTNRSMPSTVVLSDAEITDDGGTFTWTIGDENFAGGEYMVTSVVNTPDSISQYVAPSLKKEQVEWLGVSHANFMEEAERMAAYRGGTATDVTLSNGTTVSVMPEVPRNTHIVDVADVINQYGHGYNLPGAIQSYFRDAYNDWSRGQLKYGVLFGDATVNPHQRPCLELCDIRGEWDTSFETFVVTDMQMIDRFAGMVPTDHTFANLLDDGTDTGIAPEIAVGRFAVNTLQEAANVVDKVILYEYNQQIDAAYLDNLIFFADNADGTGDHCSGARSIIEEVNDLTVNTFTVNQDYVNEFTGVIDGTTASGGNPYCLDDYMAENQIPESQASFLLRDDMLAEINSTGAAIVNYNGTAFPESLASIINANRDVDDTFNPDNGGAFTNNDQPMVWIAITSLNGDFAYPSIRRSSLSERILRLDGLTGAAGYWATPTLGFDREHRAFHQGFYEALYTLGEDGEPRGPYTAGDAVMYSKIRYVENSLGNNSEIWGFLYQGDPAMAMPHAELVTGLPDFVSPLSLTLSTTKIVQTTIWVVLLGAAVILASVTVFNINKRTQSL